ncbi:voltage-dependent calcium channel T type alpha-1G [Mariprofundus micogutta]|uniref:Voltage-dependent calcium channel T type alpha-1G n=1 Tax=Mariprofundus micogutta TaxID=1921010 RepID=A0A1L8CK95_9PROT|nr:ion transporter [Mariprofundus micogutta]GAV19332.1 voltage-dependent calcium channel T type alpha-1G [Mariprofundus micogutta]
MQLIAQKMIQHRYFEYFIVSVILISAALIGMETSPALMAAYGDWIDWGNRLVLLIFILEAAIKIYAVAPKVGDYFRQGWNVFDFTIILLALIPSTGDLAMLARVARLLRVLRLISAIPELRLIVATLMKSIPSMGNIMLLMGVIFYIYAVAGQQLFHKHDPQHWDNLGIALLTLFRIVTLEDWTDVMYTAMEMHPLAWIYFVSFVIMGTFVIINLFIAVVLNNLDEAKAERLKEMRQPPTRDCLMKELEQTQQALEQLRTQLTEVSPETLNKKPD